MADTESNPIVDRLIQFIEYTGLTSTQFADKAGIPRPSLSQILHGRNKSVNNQLLAKLNSAFPELNIVWLLFNQGDMLTRGNIEFSEPQNTANSTVADRESIDNSVFTDSDEQDFEDLFNFQNRNSEPIQPQNTSNSATRPSDKSVQPINPDLTKAPTLPDPATDASTANSPGEVKKISSIIVFYTDGTFTTFRPAEE